MPYYRRRRSRKSASSGELLFALAGILSLLVVAGVGREYMDRLVFWFVPIVIAILIGGMAGLLFISYRKWQRQRSFELANIDEMDGVPFEYYLKGVLESRGYSKVFVTKKRGGSDFGVDLVATLGGVRYAVQAKRYRGNLGVSAVQEVRTGMAPYSCERGIVITNSYFTKQAKQLAKDNGVELIDRDTLVNWILEYQKAEVGFKDFVRSWG